MLIYIIEPNLLTYCIEDFLKCIDIIKITNITCFGQAKQGTVEWVKKGTGVVPVTASWWVMNPMDGF